MFEAKVRLARAARVVSRRTGRGGTTAPGRLLLRLDEHAIGRLGARLDDGAVLLSATNGKTTTASMLAGILERAGEQVVRNRAGSNMHWGVATALLDAGRERGELGLLEVDEAWLPAVAAELDPRALVLCNLFRDQLDRYGELETLADRWAELVAQRDGRSSFVLNADDPLVADLGRDRSNVTYFGVEDDSLALPELQHASDSKHCRRCGHAYTYEAVYLAHLGHYHCPNCGQKRPTPTVVATDVELRGIKSAAFTLDGEHRVELPLPGLYNVYNALGAAALTRALGIPTDGIVAGLQAVEPAFGRAETLDLNGRPASILLVKNPAGANEVLRTLALEGDGLDLLGVLNDRTADGRDVSWVWDADWELLASKLARMTCAGTRAAELALRLKYAGLPTDRITVVEELEAGLDRALEGAGPLYVIPTYTALLELRELLTRRGQAEAYWR